MRFFYREKTSEWPVKPKYRVEATEKSKNPPKCKSGHPEKPKCNLDIEQERQARLKNCREREGAPCLQVRNEQCKKAAYPQATTSQDPSVGASCSLFLHFHSSKEHPGQALQTQAKSPGLHRPSEKEAPDRKSGQQEGKVQKHYGEAVGQSSKSEGAPFMPDLELGHDI